VLMSMTAAWALGLAVPRTWIRFLGILPLAIGVNELVQMHEEKPAVLLEQMLL
jgi:cadmium resistance protein CadD (predicted permease)